MHLLLKYVIGLVVILFCTHISWCIETQWIKLKEEIPDIARLQTVRAKKNNRNQKILQCLTRGKDITLKWSFNNTEISESDSKYKLQQSNAILIINDVKPHDSGDYRCIASNKYGMIFEEIRLKIVGIGEFKDGYRNNDMPLTQNVTIGKPYELKCPKHTHLPGQIYTWAVPPLEFWRTGNPIDRVFQSDKHGALYFSFVKSDDIRMIDRKGGIACILYNDYSNLVVSTQIKLRSDAQEYTEMIGPKIVVPLKGEMTAVKGDDKTLTCGATGRPHPDFKWFKDGKLISREDSDSESTVANIYFEGKGIKLKMNPVVAADAGKYKCVASNSEGSVETEGSLTVHSKVTWTKTINRKNFIPVKQPITFECSAQGFPEPNYIWYHNNSVINSSSQREIKDGRLHIPVSDFPDCGMYLCTAENMLNTIVSPAYVVIQDVAPVITKGLSNSTYYFLFGDDKSLKCEATGGPKPTITWYKDDALIVNSKSLTVKPDGTLLFNDVTKGENGVYKCVAKNRKAEVSSSGTVRVYYIAPVIVKGFSSTTYYFLYGDDESLICDATGVPEPSITWYKDDKLIENSTHLTLRPNGTLLLNNVTKDQSGVYKCVAKNAEAEVSSSGTIIVFYIAPVITKDLSNSAYNIPYGHDKSLQCVATGVPEPTIRWYKDDTPIENSKHLTLKPNGTLLFNNVTKDQNGVYKCVAKNVEAEVSSSGTVRVFYVPPVITKGLRNSTYDIQYGGDESLKCAATGFPEPTITWYKDDKLIENSKHLTVKPNGTLLFSDVTKDQNGVYKCVAKNPDTDAGSSGTVRIYYLPPVFTKGHHTSNSVYNIQYGDDKSLKCVATGFPEPTMSWYKDDKPIENSKHMTVKPNGTLLFTDITKDQNGVYKCVAKNPDAEVSSSGSVIVYYIAPVIVKGVSNATYYFLYGDDESLECTATGVPEPTITWYKDDKPIGNSKHLTDNSNGTLLFNDVTKDQNGVYKCVAKNAEAEVSSSGTVRVFYVAPVIVKGFSSTTYYIPHGDHESIECAATGIPAPTITWYKDDKPIENRKHLTVKPNGRLLFDHATKDQNGVYKCVAKNAEAEVNSSGTVRVFSRTSITKRPAKVRYSAGKSAFLFCDAEFDTDLTTTWQWLKDGKLIDYDDKLFLKDSKRTDKVVKSHTLQIDDLNADNGGVYTCKVFSKDDATFYSGDTSNGSVTIIMAPLPAGNLKITGTFDKSKKADGGGDGGDGGDGGGGGGGGGAVDPTKKTDPAKSDDAADSTKTTDPNKSDDAAGPTKTSDPTESDDAADVTKKTDPAKSGDAVDPTKTTDPKISDDVVLSWDKPNKFVGPADEYIIEYAPAGTPKDPPKGSPQWTRYDPPNKYKDTNVKLDKEKLPASEDVIFRVRAVSNDKGKEMIGEPSEPTEAGQLVTPARAPSSKPLNVRLEMDDDKGNASAVTWDKLDDADKPGPGFEVEVAYRERGSNEPFTKSTSDGDESSAEGPPVSDTGEDKEYEVVVKSKNDEGEGPEEKYFLKVPGKKVSEKVILVKLVSRTTNGATITWQDVPGATGYRIYYTKKDNTRRRRRSTETYIDVVANEATISDLKKGSQYEIEVAAMNLKGVGPRSDPLPVKTKKGVPGVPDGVDIATYADKVKLSWPTPDDPDIKNYTVTWFPKNDPSQKKEKDVSGDDQQAFITDNLDPDTYYTVELTANSDEGSGDPWVVEGVVVGEGDKPGKPAPPIADAINTTKINVTFKLPLDNLGGLPSSFQICYPDGSAEKCFQSEYPGKPFVVIDSLDYWKTYHFFSIAKNKKGKGEKSDIVSEKPLDPPTTTPLPTTTAPTTTKNETIPVVVPVDKAATFRDDKAFYEELWFIILLIILIILIIIAIILCIICNRRGGRYPVGEKEKHYGGWDKEALKDYDDDSAIENGAGVPLVPPNRSPDRDSIKKTPFQDDVDDDVDSLADYTEGYGDMGQYGSDKKETNGQTVC